MLDSQLHHELSNVDDLLEPTQEFTPYEIVALNPDAYTKEQVLTAFRAANIALAHAIILGGEVAQKAQSSLNGYNGDIEVLGRALVRH